MTDPKDMKVVQGAFHGSCDAETGVVTDSVVQHEEAEDIEQSEDEDVRRFEDNKGVEPGP